MSLKITYLYLENFACIISGLKKPKMELDLRDAPNAINILVGPIGSGKTFILSHLQPFATVGTLDVRNQDDQIIPHHDGFKIIEYDDEGITYSIKHEYIWNEKSLSHSTKSYISKDGEDLNPSGNVSSFKYIIQSEFGLEPNYLRLIRLGANVSGILDLSATERKTYVASMLEKADIILAMNKKFREELRNYNAQISVLTNKLAQLGFTKFEDYESEIEAMKEELDTLESQITSKRDQIVKLQSEMNLLVPNGISEFQKELNESIDLFNDLSEKRNVIEKMLVSLEGNTSSTELARQVGNKESEVSNLNKDIIDITADYDKTEKEVKLLEEKIQIMQSDNHLALLKETYENLKEELDRDRLKLNGFECKYNSSYIKNLVNNLHNIDLLIDQITQYEDVIINRLWRSDASVISWAKERGEILTGKKVNLQKKINNLSYSATYQVMGVLFTPPFCPTKDCPYKKTHPYTLIGDKSKTDLDREVEDLKNEIDSIDKELYNLANYAPLYNLIVSFKNQFNDACKVLEDIGALNTGSGLLVLTRLDLRKWYNYDRIIDVQELCILQESYHERIHNLYTIQEELAAYEKESLDILLDKVKEKKNKLNELDDNLHKKSDELKEANAKLNELVDLYNFMLSKALEEERLKEYNRSLIELKDTIGKNTKILEKVLPSEEIIKNLSIEINQLNGQRERIANERNSLVAKVNDIKYTKHEMEDVQKFQKYLGLMVDATSAKEGIPLHMINNFVTGCKDIVNDLTFNIFEDDILLEDFEINEKEFYIPYSVNGKIIPDVTKASQGQKSLFSIAIAFAFLQHARIRYNIPLLDEVDGPLHKSEQAKCLSMILRQLKCLNSKQAFLITHNSFILENIPVNFIATAEEDLNTNNGSIVIPLY